MTRVHGSNVKLEKCHLYRGIKQRNLAKKNMQSGPSKLNKMFINLDYMTFFLNYSDYLL